MRSRAQRTSELVLRLNMTGRDNCLTVALFAAVLLTSGCASYRHRVADDFGDSVKLKVGVGFGLYADAKVTSFFNPGLGWGGYWQNVGLESRYTGLVHPSLNGCPFPVGLIPGALPDESPIAALRMANVRGTCRTDVQGDYSVVGQLFDAEAITKWDAYGIQKRSPHVILHNPEPTHTEGPLGFEASVGMLFLNVRVGFDPVEFVDLLCTVCGFDLLRDNKPREQARCSAAPLCGRTVRRFQLDRCSQSASP